MRSTYISVINSVQKILQQNKTQGKDCWEQRYAQYASRLKDSAFLDQLSQARAKFRVWKPLCLYMSVSAAMNQCTSRTTVFELRFHGQSVATLHVPTKGAGEDIRLNVKKSDAVYKALQSAQMADAAQRLAAYANDTKILWHDSKAQDFRKIYAELEKALQTNANVKMIGQPEHEMESELLQNYGLKTSGGKEICDIQPIKMGDIDAHFQMPTPISASKARRGAKYITYAAQRGGGIDILVRMNRSRGATLGVLELKDEPEPPEKAICQAIAYAVFLRELLRSASGDEWWKFFGFSGSLPKKLRLKAVIVMPNPDKPSGKTANTKFAKMELPIGNDIIKTGYIYRDNPRTGMPAKACI